MEKRFVPLILLGLILLFIYIRSEQVRINGKYTIATLIKVNRAKSGRVKIYRFSINNNDYNTHYSSFGASDSFIICQFLPSDPSRNRPITDVLVPINCQPANLIGLQWSSIEEMPLY
jgi:hypothetical protein